MNRPDAESSNPIRPCRGPLRRPVALPVAIALAFMAATSPIAGCSWSELVRGPERPAATAAAKLPPRTPSAAERFSSAQERLAGDIEAAIAALKKGRDASGKLAAVASGTKGLRSLDAGMRSWFADTRGVLAKIHSKEKDAIQARVEKTYASRLATLTSRLTAVESAEGTSAKLAALSSADAFLTKIAPEEVHQPLGTQLPHRIVDAKAGPPVLGTSIAPAYAPNTSGAVASPLPPTPTAEDLTQTVEVTFDDDIASLATSLGHDPVRIYEHVRNTIDFEPYYGSRKGALETLWEGAGNDIDTASLLIALMRQSDIPARYVSGVVEVPIDKAMNWVGVEKPEAAAKLFSAGGTPVKAIVSGGKIVRLQLTHTWTEVYVPYESYRGVATGPGEPKKQWIPLDASFKGYERSPSTLSSLHQEGEAIVDTGFIETLAAQSSTPCADGSVATLPVSVIRQAFADAVARASLYATTHPYLSVDDVMGQCRIASEGQGLLPASPLLKPVSVSSEWSRVPDERSWFLSIGLGHYVLRRALPEIAGRRVTLSFCSPDSAETSFGQQYEDIADLPAYLTGSLPVLRVDGEYCGQGQPTLLGSPVDVRVTLQGPGCEPSRFNHTLTAGSYYVFTADGGPTPATSIRTHWSAYAAAAEAVSNAATTPTQLVSLDDYLGESLYLPVRSYLHQLTAGVAACARLQGAAVVRTPGLVLSGVTVDTASALGIPLSVDPRGLFIDVDEYAFAAQARNQASESVRHVVAGTAALASELEHVIWEQFLDAPGRGISAAKVIREAEATGVPLHLLNRTNIDEGLEESTGLPLNVRESVKDSVAQGRTVIMPARPVALGSWSGFGWVVEDEVTGSSAYMLAGGLAGGEYPFYDKDWVPSAERIVIGRTLAGASLMTAAVAKGAETPVGLLLRGGSNLMMLLGAVGMYEDFTRCVTWLWFSPATESLGEAGKAAYCATAAAMFITYIEGTAALWSTFSAASVAKPEQAVGLQMLRGIIQAFMNVMFSLSFTLFLPMLADATAD